MKKDETQKITSAIGNINFVLADAKKRLTDEELETLRETRLLLQGMLS